MIHLRHEFILGVLILSWIGMISSAYCAWETYDHTPGEQPATVAPIEPNGSGWQLVMYAHPKCPCLRAAFIELAEIAAATTGKLQIRVVFVRPTGRPEGWERTPRWHQAESIPGVTASCEPEGEQIRAAGAATSGHVILFDPAGKPAYSGGITHARGYVGSNTGERAVQALVANKETATRTAPVYGCPLFTPSTH